MPSCVLERKLLPGGAPSRTVLWWSCAEEQTGSEGPCGAEQSIWNRGSDGGGMGAGAGGGGRWVLGARPNPSPGVGLGEVLKSHVAAQPMLQDYVARVLPGPWIRRAHTAGPQPTSRSLTEPGPGVSSEV